MGVGKSSEMTCQNQTQTAWGERQDVLGEGKKNEMYD